ncbi:uncharacterized protein LOC132203869 isoform X2 [Neocloeon triangulifer]|uniref:uncharacterized protein LOC132203869 isoform X2 n=1 Tax=Neocloeon triangulifer TaxID=2078957 RepID=UPI00286EC5F9|nr:uncharacterized protein LOC132203869 isoform X2 [Neocloeon triangulifer]
MRTVVTNLAKLDPDSIGHLPNRVTTAILEAVTKSIPGRDACYVRPELGLDFAPDGSCIFKKIYYGFTNAEKDSLQPDLSTLKRLITSDLQDFDFKVIEKDSCIFSKESEEIWECLASSAPNLRSVRDLWTGSRKLRPGHLILPYLAKFPNLGDLDLITFRFSDEDMEVLSRSCPNLRSISLTKYRDLTTEGLRSLGNLPLLEKISFVSVSKYGEKPKRNAADPSKSIRIAAKPQIHPQEGHSP